MKLIENWKSAWRFYSTRSFTISLGIGAALAWMSKDYPDIYAQIPGWGLSLIGVLMAFGFVVSRLVRQDAIAQPPDGEDAP